jgi:hypothetical protein
MIILQINTKLFIYRAVACIRFSDAQDSSRSDSVESPNPESGNFSEL